MAISFKFAAMHAGSNRAAHDEFGMFAAPSGPYELFNNFLNLLQKPFALFHISVFSHYKLTVNFNNASFSKYKLAARCLNNLSLVM